MPNDGAAILEFLDSLSANAENNLIRGALRAAAKVAAERAKELAGNLRTPEIKGKHHTTPSELVADAVYVTTGTRNGPHASVKIKGFAASVAIWAEYGTLPHWISVDVGDRTTKKGVVSIRTLNKNEREGGGSLVIGGKFVGPSVYHPGADKHPFFLQAGDQSADAALQAGAAYITAKLEAGRLNVPDEGGDEDDDQ